MRQVWRRGGIEREQGLFRIPLRVARLELHTNLLGLEDHLVSQVHDCARDCAGRVAWNTPFEPFRVIKVQPLMLQMLSTSRQQLQQYEKAAWHTTCLSACPFGSAFLKKVAEHPIGSRQRRVKMLIATNMFAFCSFLRTDAAPYWTSSVENCWCCRFSIPIAETFACMETVSSAEHVTGNHLRIVLS